MQSRLFAVALALWPALTFAQGQLDAVIDLPFSRFFAQPIGPRGLEPTPQLLAAQGQVVRLTGYMVQREQPQPGGFLLTPRPVQMSEHADGEADDLPAHTVTVLLAPEQRERWVAYRPGRIAVTGVLEMGPAQDATGRVSWLRLHLNPEALTPSATSTPSPSHSHP